MKKIAFIIAAVAIGFAACEKDESSFEIQTTPEINATDVAVDVDEIVESAYADVPQRGSGQVSGDSSASDDSSDELTVRDPEVN